MSRVRSAHQPSQASRVAERGVTLIELMAVVVIIGIFVALASPAMSGVLQDRHAMRAADDLSGMIRLARTRATATGAAHLVRATPSGSSMKFELRAAMGTLGGPISSCITPTWVATDSVQLSMLDFGTGTGSYAGRDIIVKPVTDALGTTGTSQDFCFTPGGTPWWKVSGAWTRPTGSQISRYEIIRQNAAGALVGIRRVVRVSPTGVPSIEAN
ncbi:MAG: pilus assembly FimT family protein [Polyangiales bacterium]